MIYTILIFIAEPLKMIYQNDLQPSTTKSMGAWTTPRFNNESTRQQTKAVAYEAVALPLRRSCVGALLFGIELLGTTKCRRTHVKHRYARSIGSNSCILDNTSMLTSLCADQYLTAVEWIWGSSPPKRCLFAAERLSSPFLSQRGIRANTKERETKTGECTRLSINLSPSTPLSEEYSCSFICTYS